MPTRLAGAVLFRVVLFPRMSNFGWTALSELRTMYGQPLIEASGSSQIAANNPLPLVPRVFRESCECIEQLLWLDTMINRLVVEVNF
jgi:hypothetical protein